MVLDQDRLSAILEAEHSYYGSRPAADRRDSRLNPQARDIIASQLRPEMRVLDIGCGSGATLLENSPRFASGLSIDNARHISAWLRTPCGREMVRTSKFGCLTSHGRSRSWNRSRMISCSQNGALSAMTASASRLRYGC